MANIEIIYTQPFCELEHHGQKCWDNMDCQKCPHGKDLEFFPLCKHYKHAEHYLGQRTSNYAIDFPKTEQEDWEDGASVRIGKKRYSNVSKITLDGKTLYYQEGWFERSEDDATD